MHEEQTRCSGNVKYILICMICFIIECAIGYYGADCEEPCLYPYYGENCNGECDCLHQYCNISVGCLRTFNSFEFLKIIIASPMLSILKFINKISFFMFCYDNS